MSPRRSSARLVDCFQLSATMKERRFQECCHEKLARKWPTKRQERCESGRIGLTANELSVERRTQGSNPCLSARGGVGRSLVNGSTQPGSKKSFVSTRCPSQGL